MVKAAPVLRLLGGAEFPGEVVVHADDPSELRTRIHSIDQTGDVDIHTMIPAEEVGPADSAVAEYSGGVER